MSSIQIVALVTVKPEYTEALAAQFKELVKASRAEEGNISYDLHQEIGKPNRFVFVESWKSQAAIDEHNASEHFQNFVKSIEGKTEALEIVLTYLSPTVFQTAFVESKRPSERYSVKFSKCARHDRYRLRLCVRFPKFGRDRLFRGKSRVFRWNL